MNDNGDGVVMAIIGLILGSTIFLLSTTTYKHLREPAPQPISTFAPRG